MKKIVNRKFMILTIKVAFGLAIADGCFNFGRFVGWDGAMMSVSTIGYEATKQNLNNMKGSSLQKAAYRNLKETLDSCEELIPILNGILARKTKVDN